MAFLSRTGRRAFGRAAVGGTCGSGYSRKPRSRCTVFVKSAASFLLRFVFFAVQPSLLTDPVTA
jgi:hypothetical protein